MKKMKKRLNFLGMVFTVTGLFSLPVFSGEPVPYQAAASPPALIQATDTRTLLNGLRIEILSMPQAPRVSLHLLIGAGSALDPVGKAGVAELTMATLIQSVPDWQGDPQVITRVVEAGRNFRYEVEWDTTHLFAECAPDEISIYLQALTRFVRYTTLSPVRFEKVRSDFMKAAAEEKPSPRLSAEKNFDRILFRGNPYARPLKGTADTLKNIVFGDTVGFQRKYHLPNVSFLSVVGPVQADELRSLAGRYLGIWIMDRAFPYTFTPAVPPKALQVASLDAPDSAETVLIVGQLMVPRGSSDFVAVELLADILQSTRWESFPDARVSGELTARKLKGSLRFIVQKQGLAVGKALGEIRQRWAQLAQTGPSADECSSAVSRYLSTLQEKARSSSVLARMLCLADAYQLGFNFFERLKSTLPRISPADLRLTAQKHLTPDQILAVVSGPLSEPDKEELRKQGWAVVPPEMPVPVSKP